MSIPTPRETVARQPTWQEELDWLDLLASDSGRVRIHQVGTASGGRAVNLVGVGGTGAPPAPDQAPPGGLLFVCFQHGHEPAPREAALRVLRDLAYTTDPDVRAYLDARPVWVMPSTNADRAPYVSFTDGGREQLQGIDINRSHISLAAPEALAIQRAITLTRAEVVVDVHEGATAPDNVEVGGPMNTNVTTQARAWADNLVAAIITDLQGKGYVASPWAATGWPPILRNTAGLRHTVSAIIEGRTADTGMQMRVDQVADSMDAAVAYHRANAAAISADLAAGRTAARAAGAAGAGVTFTGEGYGTVVLDPGPIAYRITAAQHATLATHLDVFGITATPDGDGFVIDMAQDAQPVIPFLMDPLSPDKIVTAARVLAPPPRDFGPAAQGVKWGPVRLHGVDRRVMSVQVVVDGELIPVANY